ncbi:hypothetical protein BDZ97DRAFT_1797864 [Flammula alnicola]|nr:hypothetical protein BDZ97DRAFT_1797864 [Flammula alnicola]
MEIYRLSSILLIVGLCSHAFFHAESSKMRQHLRNGGRRHSKRRVEVFITPDIFNSLSAWSNWSGDQSRLVWALNYIY